RLAEQVWPRAAVADHGAAGLAEARGLVPVALGQVQGLTADLVAYPLVIAHQLQHVGPGQWAVEEAFDQADRLLLHLDLRRPGAPIDDLEFPVLPPQGNPGPVRAVGQGIDLLRRPPDDVQLPASGHVPEAYGPVVTAGRESRAVRAVRNGIGRVVVARKGAQLHGKVRVPNPHRAIAHAHCQLGSVGAVGYAEGLPPCSFKFMDLLPPNRVPDPDRSVLTGGRPPPPPRAERDPLTPPLLPPPPQPF